MPETNRKPEMATAESVLGAESGRLYLSLLLALAAPPLLECTKSTKPRRKPKKSWIRTVALAQGPEAEPGLSIRPTMTAPATLQSMSKGWSSMETHPCMATISGQIIMADRRHKKDTTPTQSFPRLELPPQAMELNEGTEAEVEA
jgi:hypothetical protein